MSSSAGFREVEARAVSVSFDSDVMRIVLSDGRELGVPLIWFPRLQSASLAQLNNYKLMGAGEGIHWPELDEDISVNGVLHGRHPGIQGHDLKSSPTLSPHSKAVPPKSTPQCP
jgi:hypothetical protein